MVLSLTRFVVRAIEKNNLTWLVMQIMLHNIFHVSVIIVLGFQPRAVSVWDNIGDITVRKPSICLRLLVLGWL